MEFATAEELLHKNLSTEKKAWPRTKWTKICAHVNSDIGARFLLGDGAAEQATSDEARVLDQSQAWRSSVKEEQRRGCNVASFWGPYCDLVLEEDCLVFCLLFRWLLYVLLINGQKVDERLNTLFHVDDVISRNNSSHERIAFLSIF